MSERHRLLVAGAVAAALLAGCSAKSADETATPSAAPTIAPTAAPAVPTAAPTIAPTAAPTIAPTTAPTSAPTAAPTVAPKAVAPPRDPAVPDGVPIAASDAPPKIVSIVQSPVQLRGGAPMTFDVTTSSNVASVELRAQSFGNSMKRTQIGKFTFSAMVPPLPPLVPHTFAVSFIARNAAGVASTQTITVTIH